jgi:hypothetical protein
VASMLLHFETNDYEAWKQRFDSDPAGRSQSATGHSIARAIDNPNAVFVRAEFRSIEQAKAFRQRLLDSGALDSVEIKMGPTVVEQTEHVNY